MEGSRTETATTTRPGAIARLSAIYDGDTARAHRFRYGLLIFDLVTVGFVIFTSFLPPLAIVEAIDRVFGIFILADFVARLAIAPSRLRFLVNPVTLADIAAIASFLAPVAGEGFGFLRILRTLRLLRTYQLVDRLRADFAVFRRHEDVLIATVNLFVFLFVMTGIIYVTQHHTNPDIRNYADALYFTVTTLTTTGFGDITLHGTSGRMLAVAVMIFGVTLFLRLLQVLFRPPKVHYTCRECGLSLHDADAIHCKHCGAKVRIETEGFN
ncbi:MAG: potassium channel family protein [Rhodobacteraceae bacterium]|nr:potassium channel family protein [Paracoccaceae bacterium]